MAPGARPRSPATTTGIVAAMWLFSLPSPVRGTLVLARESLYVTVGAGVLAVQKIQVQRREWESEIGRRSAGPTGSEPG